MSGYRRFIPFFIFPILLLCLAPIALGAEPRPETYRFLLELARIRSVEGFPPRLFEPASQPSRIEIAFFLFRFDQELAEMARGHDYSLQDALERIWLEANPQGSTTTAAEWAGKAAVAYRRLLIEYGREMDALGYRLRPDAYPPWARGTSNALGD